MGAPLTLPDGVVLGEGAPADMQCALDAWHDKRVSQGTLDYWRRDDATGVVVLAATATGDVIGASGVSLTGGGAHAATVVHPQWRRRGVGSAMLAARLRVLPTTITCASDHEAGVALCRAVGLEVLTSVPATRRRTQPHTFDLLVWGSR